MANKLDICNLALIYLRKKPIKDLGSSSLEATTMSRLYPLIFDFLLREHPWSFCSKVKALALCEEVSPLYRYVYQYPTDCAKVEQLVSPESIHKSQDYEVASGSMGSKVILTDVGNAVLRYSEKLTDTSDFDPSFVLVLAARLAADAAINLTGKAELWEAAERRYIEFLNKAKLADAKESKTSVDELCDLAQARL